MELLYKINNFMILIQTILFLLLKIFHIQLSTTNICFFLLLYYKVFDLLFIINNYMVTLFILYLYYKYIFQFYKEIFIFFYSICHLLCVIYYKLFLCLINILYISLLLFFGPNYKIIFYDCTQTNIEHFFHITNI